MAQDFADLGRREAIRSLFEGTGFKAFQHKGFQTLEKSYIRTENRTFIEGTDFDLTYFPLVHLGHKCVTAVTGELVARMVHVRSLNVVLGVSAKLSFTHIQELWKGIVEAAKEYGYTGLDLDLVPSRNGLSISVSATGETNFNTEKGRPQPKSMDLLCVSGRLGAAYIGLCVLEREKKNFEKEGAEQPKLDKYRMFVGEYLHPELDSSVVSRLEETDMIPSSGCVIRFGLADAVSQLANDAGLGAKIYADKIPFEGNSTQFSKELGIDPIKAAMHGGDDYKILFTIPIIKAELFRRDFQTFDIIGHLAQKEVGTTLVLPDGAELPVSNSL